MEMFKDGVDFTGELGVLVDEVCVLIIEGCLTGGETGNGVFEPIRGGLSGSVVGHGGKEGRSDQC